MSVHQQMIRSQEHVTRFFQELYAAADTDIAENDSVDVQINKLAKQLSILHRMVELAAQPAFRDVEGFLTNKARAHDEDVYEAILKDDQGEIKKIAIARMGIVQLLECFEAAKIQYDNVLSEMESLKDPEDDPTGLEDTPVEEQNA